MWSIQQRQKSKRITPTPKRPPLKQLPPLRGSETLSSLFSRGKMTDPTMIPTIIRVCTNQDPLRGAWVRQ